MSVKIKKYVIFLVMNISKSKYYCKAKRSLLGSKFPENSILNFSVAVQSISVLKTSAAQLIREVLMQDHLSPKI